MGVRHLAAWIIGNGFNILPATGVLMRTLAAVFALSLFAGCGTTSEDSCTDGAYRCTEGEILELCTDEAWAEDENCMDLGLMCHAEMGHCMAGDSGM